MYADVRTPDSLVFVPSWKRPTPTTRGDTKDSTIQSGPQTRTYQRQSSSQKSCYMGLEFTPALVWEDWDPGREFAKSLLIKNVTSKTQKLRIRPPQTKFFSLSHPRTVFLSPGTFLSTPVIFRPVGRCEYEDCIEVQGAQGNFQICLRAIILCPLLEAPESLLVPICAVDHFTQSFLTLKNTSKLHSSFEWESPTHFKLSPARGRLKPGHDCQIMVIFRPEEALFYQQLAQCKYGEHDDHLDCSCSVLLQGLAKYPFLQIKIPNCKEEDIKEDPVLYFKSVTVGQTLRKHFEIFNHSLVNVNFSLSRPAPADSTFDSEFSCDITEGEVAPGATIRIPVTFSPEMVKTSSVEYMVLSYEGSITDVELKLIGSSIGPNVSLSSTVLDFGCVNKKERKLAMTTVNLINYSEVEAFYQWDIDRVNSVFSIIPTNGVVPAQSYIILRAFYKPMYPKCHHRRVACLVLHKDPLFLDMIGTCHAELQQPVILKPEHLILYKLQWLDGQPSSDPICTLQQDYDSQMDQDYDSTSVKEKSSQSPFVPSAAMEEFYQICSKCVDPPPLNSSTQPLSIVPGELMFNHRKPPSFSPSSFSQPVTIINHTKGQLSLMWTIGHDCPFSITPSTFELAPLKSTSIQVTYVPNQLNLVHAAQFECFAYYKDNFDSREQLLSLPWCVILRVIGQSFEEGKEHFIPSYTLTPRQVLFPPLNSVFYETVLIKNSGDFPLIFCQGQKLFSRFIESIQILPSCGIVPPGCHRILTLRAMPRRDSPKEGFQIRLQLNGAKPTKEISVLNVLERPRVAFRMGGSLYFHPVAVGAQSKRSHVIKNLSRLPLRFLWKIAEEDQQLISVEPVSGEIDPNDCSAHIWSFSPVGERAYLLKPILSYWPLQSDGTNTFRISLKILGIGVKASLQSKEAVYLVEDTLIGTCRTIEVPLVNNSQCPVSFYLTVQQTLTEKSPTNGSEIEENALQLDFEKETIASHSTMILRCTFKPSRKGHYVWSFFYQTLDKNGMVSCSPLLLCEVNAKAVFPTLQVIDGCSSDNVGRINREHLWKLFSLDSLNEILLCKPSPKELTYKIPTRHSVQGCPYIFTTAIVDFNFSLAPLHSKPTHFSLVLHNPGTIPVEWAFLFPEDQQIELEYWAVTGVFTSDELYQMKVQYNQLFSVSPRFGTLNPGQQRAVHFSYCHDLVGTYRLPVVFKLSFGREILLNFQGITVENEAGYLHFASTQHTFNSVAIMDESPPKQVYELWNGGAVPVDYEVDLAALSKLQLDNFNHPLLQCLNPKGQVLPGHSLPLDWIFSPLEAKKYLMDVQINVENSKPTTLRFEGWGCTFLAPTSSDVPFKTLTATTKHCAHRKPFSGQALFLSEQCIVLGDVPVCSQTSRILFLTNVSTKDVALYEWELPLHDNQQVVHINPIKGRLLPGEWELCVFTFVPSEYPAIYQLDVVCRVVLEATWDRHLKTLHKWEEEKQRQREEFTITDKKLLEKPKVFIDKIKQTICPPARRGPPLKAYKTLPPILPSGKTEIKDHLFTRQPRDVRRSQQKKFEECWRPEPPTPTLLHLSVSAHSFGTLEYFTRFPDQNKKFIRNLEMRKTLQRKTAHSAGSPTATHSPCREIIQDVLNSLICDVFSDSVFKEFLASAQKPILYRPAQIPPCNRYYVPASFYSPSPPMSASPPLNPPLSEKVNRKGHAGCPNTKQQRQATPTSKLVSAGISQIILMNTFQNLVAEAVRGELLLSMHTFAVSLPPFSIRDRGKTKDNHEEDQ